MHWYMKRYNLIFHVFVSDISLHFHLVRFVGYIIRFASSLCEAVVHHSTKETSNQEGSNR